MKIDEIKEELKGMLRLIASIDETDELAYEKAFLMFKNIRYIPVLTIKIDKGDQLFRSRTHENDDFYRQFSDVVHPPNAIVKKFARVNRPFQSVFYGAENRPTSYLELVEYWAEQKRIGDSLLVTIGHWELQRDVHLMLIPKPYIKDRKTRSEKGYGKAYDHYTSKFDEIAKLLSDTIFDFMWRQFAKPAKNDKKTYIITSSFSNLILTRDGIDGILYPSVPSSIAGEGYNIALRKDLVEKGELLPLEFAVDTFKIESNKNGKHHFVQTQSISTRDFDLNTGQINWRR